MPMNKEFERCCRLMAKMMEKYGAKLQFLKHSKKF
jgi:hypothetical protein